MRVKIIEFPVKFKSLLSLSPQGGRLNCLFSLSPSLSDDKLCKVSMKRQGSACLLEIALQVRMKAAVWTLSCSGNAPHKLQARVPFQAIAAATNRPY